MRQSTSSVASSYGLLHHTSLTEPSSLFITETLLTSRFKDLVAAEIAKHTIIPIECEFIARIARGVISTSIAHRSSNASVLPRNLPARRLDK